MKFLNSDVDFPWEDFAAGGFGDWAGMLVLAFTATAGAVFDDRAVAFEGAGGADFGALAGTGFVVAFAAATDLGTGLCILGAALAGAFVAGLGVALVLVAAFTGLAAALGCPLAAGLAVGRGAGFGAGLAFRGAAAFGWGFFADLAVGAFFGTGFAIAFGADLAGALLLDVPETFLAGFFTGKSLFVP